MSQGNGPVRVLQVLGGTSLGGAESRVMDSYRHLDRSRIQFDFCVHSQEEGFFDKEIESLGGHIYRVPRFKVVNWLAYRKAWKDFFRTHSTQGHPDYVAVHGHMTSTASIYLPIAKAAGVPLTIAHARSAGVDPGLKGAMTRFLRRNLGKKADVCLTCSRLAGEAVFGEKMVAAGRVTSVPNAIDAREFAFSEKKRKQKRVELEIGEQEFVIGHVGRFGHMKNHAFLLDVFAGICRKVPDSRLLLVGEGGLVDSVTALLDDLLPAGATVYKEDKHGERTVYSSDDEKQENMPMAVLTSGNTASAAEIFAGAIRDFHYGTLIGTKTFGKGIVQTTIPLPDGSAIKVTTARYYTPSGECIHEKGIEPDIELEYQFLGTEDQAYDVSLDNQIQKAVEVLSQEM